MVSQIFKTCTYICICNACHRLQARYSKHVHIYVYATFVIYYRPDTHVAMETRWPNTKSATASDSALTLVWPWDIIAVHEGLIATYGIQIDPNTQYNWLGWMNDSFYKYLMRGYTAAIYSILVSTGMYSIRTRSLNVTTTRANGMNEWRGSAGWLAGWERRQSPQLLTKYPWHSW